MAGTNPSTKSNGGTDNNPGTTKGTHRWVIPNLSQLTEKLVSETFVVGGSSWRIQLYPRGARDPHEHVSVFLHVTDLDSLSEGWERLRFTALRWKAPRRATTKTKPL